MPWSTENRLKTLSTILGMIIAISVIYQFFPDPIRAKAEEVYDERRPKVIEEVDKKIKNHELRMEPRLQSIEYEVTEQRKVQEDALRIQKDSAIIQQQILDELKKANQ